MRQVIALNGMYDINLTKKRSGNLTKATSMPHGYKRRRAFSDMLPLCCTYNNIGIKEKIVKSVRGRAKSC
jgi:hypothetical protein